MNYYLGIHAGHDASVSIFKNSRLICSILQERHSRIRHDFGINIDTVKIALKVSGIKLKDIKAVGLSSTQNMPLVIQSPSEINISEIKQDQNDNAMWLHNYPFKTTKLISGRYAKESKEPNKLNFIKDNLVQIRKLPFELMNNSEFLVIADPLFVPKNNSLQNPNLIQVMDNLFESPVNVEKLSRPIEVTIENVTIPGFYWSHHACHAASNISFNLDEKVVITHDGGYGAQSGGIWFFDGKNLKLEALHFLCLGWIYDFFAYKLGLGHVGGAGKLMGLAAYGTGKIPLDPQLIGNENDLLNYLENRVGLLKKLDAADALFGITQSFLENNGVDVTAIGDPSRILETAPKEIAHWVQRYVEQSMFKLISILSQKKKFENLGFSGGFALNCPTNSYAYNNLPLNKIIVEPHCEDGGCSIGAGFLTYFTTNPQNMNQKIKPNMNETYAFKGSKKIRNSLKTPKDFKIKRWNIAKKATELIIENKIIAIHIGKSEIGPRALGHRSIIANPKFIENWERVNKIKKRESWRPFAPVVIEDFLYDFFEQGPPSSPFMLFNYKVKKEFRERLAAITHQDSTSRTQTISDKKSLLYRICLNLKTSNQLPVLLNTSLNGPGEPILETEEQAVEFLETSGIDALILDNKMFFRKV